MDAARTRTPSASAITGSPLAFPLAALAGLGALGALGALAGLAALVAPADAAERWRAPVDGPVVRGFDLGADPFEPGRHRGADFAAPPGTAVRAACSGKVVVAGRVGTSGRVVTIHCGAWRATHMPLATVAVRTGATIRRGAVIGTLAPSTEHAGLHLGARRDGNRFGYTDPLRLIGHEPVDPPPVLWRRAPRGPSMRPAPPAAAPEVPQRPQAAVLRPAAQPATGTASPLAPWPAWAGLATLLAGAFGTGIRVRVKARDRRAPAPIASAQEAR